MRRSCLIAFLTALASAPGAGSVAEPPDACAAARRTNGWCTAADAGYVASVEVRSRILYEALDTHGHDVDPKGMKCESCRTAVRNDGFCPAHRMGFVGGLAYLSPLTYHLARSRVIDPTAIRCPVCRRNSGGIGWCETHRVGIAGAFAVDDRERFEELRQAYDLLLKAVEISKSCETCAAAMVSEGGYCPTHRQRYKGGEPVPAETPWPAGPPAPSKDAPDRRPRVMCVRRCWPRS